MKSRKNKHTTNKNKYFSKKHKKGGFFKSLFKPKMSKGEYCDMSKLVQINTPDKLQKNYSTCCPKSIFGKENTSNYCNSVRSKMYTLSKNNSCSDEDSPLNSYNINTNNPNELYSKYAKCCPKGNDSEYCKDFKKYLKRQCGTNNLDNLTNTESLYNNYQVCCPKGIFGTKNSSSYCKKNDRLFKEANTNEEPKEYIDVTESDIDGTTEPEETQFGLDGTSMYKTIPEDENNTEYTENLTPKLGGKNMTKRRRVKYLRKHKKYSNKTKK